jgi:hypothetical protein
MAEQNFAVVFRGAIADGADPDAVKAKLGKLFKADAARIAAMFSGKPVVIKKGLDEATARNYQAALAKAGAIAEVLVAKAKTPSADETPAKAAAVAAQEPVEEPVKADAEETPAAERPAPGTRPQNAPAVERSIREGPPQALDTSMAEPGAVLVEARPVEAADIPTGHLDMADVGADLVEYRRVAEPEYDLSGMDLAPPGSELADPKKVPPADFDTSALSLDEP